MGALGHALLSVLIVLVSGYLGRQRPPQFQGQIRSKVAAAEARGLDWLTLPTLIHGVCYSIPTGSVGRVVRDLPPGAADTGVISLFQFPNKFIAACISCSLFHFGICSTFPSHAYIFSHRIVKQIIVL